MNETPEFVKFVTRRAQLLGLLDSLRAEVDDWIANKAVSPSMSEIALLEGLIERKALLERLAEADETMVDFLVNNSGNLSPPAGKDPQPGTTATG